MLHLQKHLPISFRHQWLFSANRFTTTAASKASPDPAPFAFQDYLVATCGLTRDKAVKVSKTLSPLSGRFCALSPKADSVLSFLSGVGLSRSDIASIVARVPRLLCCDVEKVLAPRLAAFQHYGLSISQIARFFVVDPSFFHRSSLISKLQFYVPFFGSLDNFLFALKRGPYLLGANLERVVKPNVSLLIDYGLDARDISMVCLKRPLLLWLPSSRLQETVAFVDGLGIPRGKPMFRNALGLVAYRNKEQIAAKMELLKKVLQCSDAEVITMLSKTPSLLTMSDDRIHRLYGFLISDVKLDPKYITSKPSFFTYNLEGRLMPRLYVVKFLKEKGLLGPQRSYYSAVVRKEKDFVERYIHPYMEAAPLLADDYAAACRGQVASRFRSQESRTGSANV